MTCLDSQDSRRGWCRGVRASLLLACAAGVLSTAACHGPTARGIENRRVANDRFDRAGAQIAYDQAQQALINSQYKLALDTIDQAIRRFPQDASYLALRGRIQQEMRQFEGAQRTFLAALAIDPLCHECHYYLGVEAQRRSEDAEALAQYDRAWAIEPTRMQYATASIECCFVMDDLEGADERLCTAGQFFGQAAALSSLQAELHALRGDEARALQHARQAAVQSGDGPIEEPVWRMFRASDWRGCIEALSKPEAAALASRADMRRLRARCLIMTGAAAAARDELVAIELTMAEPSVEHVVLLGQAAWACDDWARVERAAAWVMAHQPDAAEGYVLAAGAAFARGHWQQTLEYADRAEQLDPGRRLVASLRRKSQALLTLAEHADRSTGAQGLVGPVPPAGAPDTAVPAPGGALTAIPVASAATGASRALPFSD